MDLTAYSDEDLMLDLSHRIAPRKLTPTKDRDLLKIQRLVQNSYYDAKLRYMQELFDDRL